MCQASIRVPQGHPKDPEGPTRTLKRLPEDRPNDQSPAPCENACELACGTALGALLHLSLLYPLNHSPQSPPSTHHIPPGRPVLGAIWINVWPKIIVQLF